MSILKMAMDDKQWTKMLKRSILKIPSHSRRSADHMAEMVGRYRQLASMRDLGHADAKIGRAPQLYQETDADQMLMARALVVVRMIHDLCDELETLTGASYDDDV